MLKATHIVPAVVVMALALSAGEASVRSAQAGPSRGEIVKAAASLMRSAVFCTFVTTEGDEPQARVVDPFEPEADLTVWIATKANTRKVAQIRKNHRVALLYFDTKAAGYVTLIGSAVLVSDAREKSKRWKDRWAALFKDANRGEDYLLIRVTPDRLEISSPSHGMNNDPVTWRPVTLDLRQPGPGGR